MTGSTAVVDGVCKIAVLVSNDTGPLHLALVLGVPSVGIFWLTNLVEGMPLRPSLLSAALAVRTRCPVCCADNRAARCPYDPSFVDEVGVDEVGALALRTLAISMASSLAGSPVRPHADAALPAGRRPRE